MNRLANSKRNLIRPIVMAVALALPGAATMSADMSDVVKTRADQNIDQQYGRDSVYGFSPESKPLKPEQTGSRDLQSASVREPSDSLRSADQQMRSDAMDNDMATSDMRLSDARSEGIHMGSGYTGEVKGSGYTGQEWQSSAASDVSPDIARAGQSWYDQQAFVIFPGTVAAPAASASDDEASNEFVIIVPQISGDEEQSAALDADSRIATD